MHGVSACAQHECPLVADVVLLWCSALRSSQRRCEKYVGTESGGMDQAISIMGDKGLAKLVHFKPVRLSHALSERP